MTEINQFCLVLDIGKTNIKIYLLNSRQHTVESYIKHNKMIDRDPYPHADVDEIWAWMLDTFKTITAGYPIHSIVVTTHGATAALLDLKTGNGLALPILDYEFAGVEGVNEEYDRICPDFSESYSPGLPGGLNVGRQLYWQQKRFPDDFARVKAILLYPQYWVWRLTGALVSEYTSLGCHTDLWYPSKKTFSAMVERQGWRHLFPLLANAWDTVATVSPYLSELTGLPVSCRVQGGVHDSNASFLRFLPAYAGRQFCVMSTGTWVVGMASGIGLDVLQNDKDMLANVDVFGNPVPCIRFMGGREYAEICSRTQTTPGQQVSEQDIYQLVKGNVFALPNFSSGSGPFGHREPEIMGACDNGNALATLYCALMIDYCIELLRVKGDVIITGSYLQNPLLCKLVAQLRGKQPVLLARDTSGTVRGAALLASWGSTPEVNLNLSAASQIEGLVEYYAKWKQLSHA